MFCRGCADPLKMTGVRDLIGRNKHKHIYLKDKGKVIFQSAVEFENGLSESQTTLSAKLREIESSGTQK